MRGSLFFRKAAALAIACVVASATLWGASTACAEEPRNDAKSYITDPYGVVGSKTAELEDALAGLNDSEGLDVRFVFVNDFSGQDGQSWAEATRLLSGSTDQEILFAIETGGLEDGYSVSKNVKLSDQQIEAVYRTYVLPSLKQENWAGSVDAAVRGFENTYASINAAAGSGSSNPATGVKPVSPISASSSSAVSPFGIILVILIALGVIAWIVLRRKRTRKKLQTQAAALTSALGTQVMALDDRIKAAQDEIGFAEASFSEDLVAPVRRQLAAISSEAVTLMTNYNTILEIADLGTRVDQLNQCAAAAQSIDARLAEPMGYLRELQDAAKRPGEALARLGDNLAGLAQGVAGAQRTQQLMAARCIGPETDVLSRACADVGVAADRAQAAFAEAQSFAASPGAAAAEPGAGAPREFLTRFGAALGASAELTKALAVAVGAGQQLTQLDHNVDVEAAALDHEISVATADAQSQPSLAEASRLLQYCTSAITSRDALVSSLPRDPRDVAGRLSQIRAEVEREGNLLARAVAAEHARQLADERAQRQAQQAAARRASHQSVNHGSSRPRSSGSSGSWGSTSGSSSRGGGGGGRSSESSRGGGGGRSSDAGPSGRGGGGGRR